MKHVPAIIFTLLAAILVIGNVAAMCSWAVGSPLTAIIADIMIPADIVALAAVLAAGAAFAAVFIYAMSKDAG